MADHEGAESLWIRWDFKEPDVCPVPPQIQVITLNVLEPAARSASASGAVRNPANRQPLRKDRIRSDPTWTSPPPNAPKIEGCPRAYASWSENEEQELLALYDAGRSTREIAGTLSRQPGAIRSRLKKLRPELFE
jgi:DNA-binding NarL/FixJ family response regulator